MYFSTRFQAFMTFSSCPARILLHLQFFYFNVSGPYQPSDDMMLMFYSYYKQATLGVICGRLEGSILIIILIFYSIITTIKDVVVGTQITTSGEVAAFAMTILSMMRMSMIIEGMKLIVKLRP